MVEKRARKRGAKCRGRWQNEAEQEKESPRSEEQLLKEAKVSYIHLENQNTTEFTARHQFTCQGHSNLAISVMANPSISKASRYCEDAGTLGCNENGMLIYYMCAMRPRIVCVKLAFSR
jgi:hypothetical protein